MAGSYNLNTDLAEDLRGQILRVPNMLQLFPSWPHGKRNTHCDQLRDAVDSWLEKVIPDVKRCHQFKRGDFGLFCSIWWPEAIWDDLYLAALFATWAFIWDDTIDTNEHILSDDLEKASAFRKESLTYVNYCLRLVNEESEEPPLPDPTSSLFKQFADGYCERVGKGDRQRFFDAIQSFFEHSEKEQVERLHGSLPNYERYMDIRHGVTAVDIFVLLLEIPLQTQLPKWIKGTDEMRGIWKECNFCIIIINDILSLRKEIATDCIINAVPVLYHSGLSLSQAITQLISEMEASRDRLDLLSARMSDMTTDDPQLHKQVMRYIDGCRRMDTGTIEYTTLVKRYDILRYVREDGGLDIVL